MSSQVISFRCTMKTQLGETLSFSYCEEVINQLGDGDSRLSALIEGLQEVRAGEKRSIRVPANRGYGSYDPSLSIKVNVNEFPRSKQIDVGREIVYTHLHSGNEGIYRVIEKTPAWIMLDGNHPLAGLDLVFEVEIVSARKVNNDDHSQRNRVLINEYIH